MELLKYYSNDFNISRKIIFSANYTCDEEKQLDFKEFTFDITYNLFNLVDDPAK